MNVERTGSIAYRPTEDRIALAADVRRLDARGAARRIAALAPAEAGGVLELLNPATARQILWELDDAQRAAVLAAAPHGMSERWTQVQDYPEGTVGRLMENPRAVFRPETTVGEAIDRLRDLVQKTLITYGFVTDEDGRLKAVFAFRDLLYADRGQKLGEIGVLDPFALRPDTKLVDAMQEVVTRHYPAYPVCDAQGRLLGMVRGHALFEAEAFEISAQAGKMQGISKEERISTPWPRSLMSRHPWLQLNLLTAFIAGGVVGFFQNTIDQIVVLAAFLPVLAGQSGNTGCQALAVTLRGMTLGEVKPGFMVRMVSKEALLGFFNGLLVGIIAGAGMWWYASRQEGLDKSPLTLGLIVCAAMVIACVASGVSGALIPLALKKAGADPATASSIFLTTMTDVASMGAFLGLSTWLLL
ncbi:MAG: magnesium transporter [Thermoanaerobaculia bacterium]|nr:magnesium transporter [Thermoanaerobaculia bacterium]